MNLDTLVEFAEALGVVGLCTCQYAIDGPVDCEGSCLSFVVGPADEFIKMDDELKLEEKLAAEAEQRLDGGDGDGRYY